MSSRIFLANSEAGLWENVIRPWFENAVPEAWKQSGATVVLVPSRSCGFFLKSKLLEAGLGFAGISFWTPHEIRSFLLGCFPDAPRIVYRENLRLLLAIAAEQHLHLPVARAIAMGPDGLMDCLDQLSSAGWSLGELGMGSAERGMKNSRSSILSSELGRIIDAFSKILEQTGFKTVQQADLWIKSRIQAPESRILNSLLVFGFDGAHWPLWNLLQAATLASQHSVVCLMEPRHEAEKIDQAWIGSWEEFLRPAKPVAASSLTRSPFADLATGMENPKWGSGKIIFHIGKNTREQAEAIATQAADFLTEESCERLGILFPRYGALSRETAALLDQLRISHNDALGHHDAIPSEMKAWKLWLALQDHPRLDPLLRFLRACPAAVASLGVPLEKVEKALEKAFSEMLVDDLPALAAFLNQSHEDGHPAIGLVLRSVRSLPGKATLAEFGCLTKEAAKTFGWEMDFRILDELAPHLRIGFSRSVFIRWLGEISGCLAKVRCPEGNHPYARVQLLSYKQADQQSWSHLILAGLNEGEWPPSIEESGFLSEKQITRLNDRALKTGSQGEGHATVKPGKGVCLGPSENRVLTQRRFCNLIESIETGLCVTASMENESQPGRQWIPSGFFTQLFLAQEKQPLSDERLNLIRDRTAEWLRRSALFQIKIAETHVSIEKTRCAFEARRDHSKPFGEFEFVLKVPPAKPITLPCKKWEDAVKDPAITWLQHVLKVEPGRAEALEDRWALSMGMWVHLWLKKGVRGDRSPATGDREADRVVSFPKHADFLAAVNRASERTQHQAREIFKKAGRPMPEWWLAGWREARWLARALAENLRGVSGFPWIEAEMKLPTRAAFACANGRALCLRGQVDLLLMERRPGKGDKAFEGQKLWVLDYKTGEGEPISAKKFARGTGVQPALYALAFHTAGAGQIDASIVTPWEPLWPQIGLAEILACQSLWDELCRMQETGIFGMRGELRPEFSFRKDYPLATLEVPLDIIETKWALTHPALAE